jgi:glycosyltransferase involved in cell wall biosynthesis
MPMRNAGAFVAGAVASILKQSERDFRFLIIDDGSDDDSLNIVGQLDDDRIEIIHDGRHCGLAARLNWGLDHADTEFVARMDADDLAAPQRLSRQLAFMEANPQVGICGSWYISLQSGSRPTSVMLPLDHDRLRAMSLFTSPFAHPTVMFNLRHLDAAGLRYSECATHAEDYELWERASDGIVFANIPEYLLFYRRHSNQVSAVHDKQQREAANSVRMRAVRRLGIDPSPSEIALHCDHASGRDVETIYGADAARAWFLNLEDIALRRGEAAIAVECALRARQFKRPVRRRLAPLLSSAIGQLGQILPKRKWDVA